jgi:hypothetical protein
MAAQNEPKCVWVRLRQGEENVGDVDKIQVTAYNLYTDATTWSVDYELTHGCILTHRECAPAVGGSRI